MIARNISLGWGFFDKRRSEPLGASLGQNYSFKKPCVG